MADLSFHSNWALLGLFKTCKFVLCVFWALETALCLSPVVVDKFKFVCVCEEPVLDSRE